MTLLWRCRHQIITSHAEITDKPQATTGNWYPCWLSMQLSLCLHKKLNKCSQERSSLSQTTETDMVWRLATGSWWSVRTCLLLLTLTWTKLCRVYIFVQEEQKNMRVKSFREIVKKILNTCTKITIIYQHLVIFCFKYLLKSREITVLFWPLMIIYTNNVTLHMEICCWVPFLKFCHPALFVSWGETLTVCSSPKYQLKTWSIPN